MIVLVSQAFPRHPRLWPHASLSIIAPALFYLRPSDSQGKDCSRQSLPWACTSSIPGVVPQGRGDGGVVVSVKVGVLVRAVVLSFPPHPSPLPEGRGDARGERGLSRGEGMQEGRGNARGERECKRGAGMQEGRGDARGERGLSRREGIRD